MLKIARQVWVLDSGPFYASDQLNYRKFNFEQLALH